MLSRVEAGDADDNRACQITITRFADGLGNVRMLAVNGADVDVTRREQGDVLLLRDVNNDGRADQHTPVARRPMMHGIAIHDGKMYLATIHEVYVADIKPDGDARRAAADLAGCAVMADGSVLVSDDRKSVAAFTPNRRGAVGR